MAADRVKQVFFLGAWRTQHVSEQLLRQISNQISSKKKVATQVKISPEGMELLLFDNKGKQTRQDKIALENIVDFISNHYRTTCTLVIVRGKEQKFYTVLVFLCQNDIDATSLIHSFKTMKKQLSGEGYNTNFTPKGKNWVLQPKNEDAFRQTANGVATNDVRVINTEKQNGGVVMINTNDRHDSFSRESIKTSNSEVKDELHNLADEVRDIKRLLQFQGSQGRTNFEKHYGYRILQSPPPVERQVLYVDETDINTRPIEPIPEKIYVKNEANSVRYTNGGPQVVRVNGRVSRSTRKLKTKGHLISVRSPTRQDYTRRVYDSENPYADSVSGIHPVRIIGRTAPSQQVVIPRQRLYKPMSQSSDIVQKNIEDVYKSRSLRKVYLPPSSQSSKTVDYVKSHVVEASPQEPQFARQKVEVSRETQPNAVHVKYNPEVRTFYEPTTAESARVESNSQGSTDVNIYGNGNVEDKMKQTERSFEIEQSETRQQMNNNVIVIKSEEEDNHRNISDLKENVTYVQNDESVQSYEPSSNEANVYHVRAEFKDEYENNICRDDHVTVIKSTSVNQENDENRRSVVRGEKVTVIRFDTPHSNDVQVDRTITNEEGVTIIENTDSFHGDVLKSEYIETRETFAEDNHDEENAGMFGEYINEPKLNEEPLNEVLNEQISDKEDVRTEIERQMSNRLEKHQEDPGLFGAYARRPDEYDEPKDEVTRTSAYRYHEDDDETIIRADNTENLHASNRLAVYVNEGENVVTDGEVIREVSTAYNENGKHIEEIEDKGIDFEKNIEIIEEKHVRYNETIEQIPFTDNEPEQLVGNVKHTRDMFEAGRADTNFSQNDFRSELSSVVTRIRRNYDDKIKEEERNSGHIEEDDDQYVLDMDAVKAYSAEPDIVIVDADNEKTNEIINVNTYENVETNPFIAVDNDENEKINTLISVDRDENKERNTFISIDTNEIEGANDVIPVVTNEIEGANEVIPVVTNEIEDANEFIPVVTNEIEDANEVIPVVTNELEGANEVVPEFINEIEDANEVIPVDIDETKSTIENVITDNKEIFTEELDGEVLKIDGQHLEMFNRVNESDIQLDPKQANVTREDINDLINTTEDKLLF